MLQIDTWCERGILGFVLAILVYSPLATGAIRPQDFVVVQWLAVGVLALWLPRFWLNPQHRLLWPPVCWAVVAFMGYAAARYFLADIEFLARQEVLQVFIYGFLFLAVVNNLHRIESIQFIALTLIALATFVALYGIIQFLIPSDFVYHFRKPLNYFKRGSGTFINPNHFAGYLELLLPLTVTYTLIGRFSHLTKVLLGYASIVIFAGILASVSRGAWVSIGLTLVALFLWLMSMPDYRAKAAVILGLFGVMAAVFVIRAELSPNRRDSLSVLMAEDDMRFRIWKPAIQIWRDNPWFGAGPGHFDYRFRQYRPTGKYPDQMQIRPDRVHNDYLNTLCDWGLAGALLVAAAFGLFFRDVVRGWKFIQRSQNDIAAKRSNKASFVMGGCLGLFAMLLHSMTDYNMHMPANAILTISLMGLVTGHFRFTTERYWHTVRWPLRLIATVIMLTAMGTLTAQAWTRTRECVWLAHAEAEPYYSNEQIRALEKAYSIQPRNFETSYLIGEGYRMQSWQGGSDYKQLAQTAMRWFERSMAANPYDPYPVIRYGMCLHWIGQHGAARPYFDKAVALDPNSHYILAHMGWHYVQMEDWKNAREWFVRSIKLFWTDNKIALTYLQIVDQKLAEAAKQQPVRVVPKGTSATASEANPLTSAYK